MTLRWPGGVLPKVDFGFNLRERNVRGGAAFGTGKSQIVASDAAIWTATLGSVQVSGRDAILAWRSLQDRLEGGRTPILIPLCRAWQPVPEGAVADGLYEGVPHSDESPFDDESTYQGRVIDVVAAGDAPRRAVRMDVATHYIGDVQAGQHFSVGERAYRIRSVEQTGPGFATIEFRPPLREAVNAGDDLEFDNPVCRMVLATDEAMDLTLVMLKSAQPTVAFIEDL